MTGLAVNALTRVATETGIDMQAVAKTDIYTVPVGFKFVPVMVIVSNPSASMAGGNDYDLGTGAAADTWLQTQTLVDLTTPVTDFTILQIASADEYEICVAGDVFGIKPITGTTAACTATIDLIGLLIAV